MSDSSQSPAPARAGVVAKEDNAVYQEGKIVARAEGADVRGDAREIHFAEINNSDELILPEECEFQKYRLIVQRIEYATRIDMNAPHKGRVLRGVVAEILGFREQ